MKKFLTETFLFMVLLLITILAVFYMADGKTDSYYARFTTGRQHSLILGTSGAAQGLQPVVFDSIIYKNKGKHFFNYSFSLFDSPFGPDYYESIINKLDPAVKDGIFIIVVNPWSLSSNLQNPNDSANFMEHKGFMGKTKLVNLYPNIPYLVKSYGEPYINIIRKWKSTTDMYVHKDGWIQIDVSMDSAEVAKRITTKVEDYRKNYLPVYKFSSLRFNYLYKTIVFLQQHGKVFLVHLPLSPVMSDMEYEVMPDFDDKINTLAEKTKAGYLNFKKMDNPYQYVDGNHLYKTSGKEVSGIIARWIVAKK
jgi:hypothetical protein